MIKYYYSIHELGKVEPKKKNIQFPTIYYVHNQGPHMIDFERFKEFFQFLKVKI